MSDEVQTDLTCVVCGKPATADYIVFNLEANERGDLREIRPKVTHFDCTMR